MTAGQKCALRGCYKPPFPSLSCSAPHLACGNLHHQLFMAGRFNPALSHSHQHIVDRNADGLCALPSCRARPHPGHSWCSRTHYLDWLDDFTASLHPNQICKLIGCTRHVFVEEDGSSWQFCGWRHRQKYVMLSAMQRHHQQPAQEHISLPSPLSSVESKCGHVPSLDSLLHCLSDYAHSGKDPKSVNVDEDFFDKHPWDVCTEGLAVSLIVRCKFTSKGKRVMATKDNYHWKQQGPPTASKNNDFTRKYFTYRRLKGKQNDVHKHHDGGTYHMEEYTIKGVKDFSIIKLRKGTDGPIIHRKGRPAADGNPSQADVPDTCSQNTFLPTSNDLSADSLFWIDDCLYDFDLTLATQDY